MTNLFFMVPLPLSAKAWLLWGVINLCRMTLENKNLA
jgi:hypothetical protein